MYFKELVVENWQVQNIQGKLTGWRPKEWLMLQLESEYSLEEECSFPQGILVFFFSSPFYGLQLIG